MSDEIENITIKLTRAQYMELIHRLGVACGAMEAVYDFYSLPAHNAEALKDIKNKLSEACETLQKAAR